MNDGNQKTIVSITPLRVEADSRTFKQATSIARFGYKSIVVEGKTSDLNTHAFAFELRSIGIKLPQKSTSSRQNVPFSKDGKSSRNQARGLLRMTASTRTYLGNVLHYLMLLPSYSKKNFFKPLKHIPKAALYYLHSPSQFPAVYLLSKIHKVPYIYDAHDFYVDLQASADSPFIKYWLLPFNRFIESKCMKYAAAVVTVNESIASLQVKEFGPHRIYILRNCHDSRLDRSPAKSLKQLLGIPSDSFLLVAVARPKSGRAIQEAIDAMEHLPLSLHLAFVGEGYESHIAQVKQRGLDRRIHFLSPVKPYEIVPFIRSADAALLLYHGESLNYENCLPNGFFQSVAAELPLLYPTLHEIEKLAGQYQLGLPINPQDPRSIADAVLKLVNQPEQYRTFKQNLRLASEALSWEREEVILRDLISQALQKQAARNGR